MNLKNAYRYSRCNGTPLPKNPETYEIIAPQLESVGFRAGQVGWLNTYLSGCNVDVCNAIYLCSKSSAGIIIVADPAILITGTKFQFQYHNCTARAYETLSHAGK